MIPSSPIQHLPIQTLNESLCDLYDKNTEETFKGYENQKPVNRVTRNARRLFFEKTDRNEIKKRNRGSTVELDCLKLKLDCVLGNNYESKIQDL